MAIDSVVLPFGPEPTSKIEGERFRFHQIERLPQPRHRFKLNSAANTTPTVRDYSGSAVVSTASVGVPPTDSALQNRSTVGSPPRQIANDLGKVPLFFARLAAFRHFPQNYFCVQVFGSARFERKSLHTSHFRQKPKIQLLPTVGRNFFKSVI